MKGLFLVTILLSVVPLHAMKEEEKLPNKLPNMECVKYFNDKFVIQELNVAGTMQSELATVKQSIVDETKYMPEPEAIIYVVQAFCTDARMKKHFDKIWDSFKDDTDSNKFTSQEIAETKLFYNALLRQQ